jgi:hypothetical protein
MSTTMNAGIRRTAPRGTARERQRATVKREQPEDRARDEEEQHRNEQRRHLVDDVAERSRSKGPSWASLN